MGLFDIVLLPVVGGPKLVQWLAVTLADQSARESRDEGPIRAQLLELHERFDAGEIGEEPYDREEDELLQRLNAARRVKVVTAEQEGTRAVTEISGGGIWS